MEHKAHGVVAVGVPVAVAVLLGGAAVDDEVAAGVTVQSTDDIQRGGLAAARGTKDGDELVFPELQVHSPQGLHGVVPYGIAFFDLR